MKWALEIQKTSLERRNLTDLLEELEFEVVDGIEYIAFTSPSFEALELKEEVWIEAKKLRDIIIGPTNIDPDFTLGAIIEYSEGESKRYHFLEVHDSVNASSICSATISYKPSPELSEKERKEFIEALAEQEYRAKLELQRSKLTPAFRNPKALKVLKLLNLSNHNGESIFKIYEHMEGSKKNRDYFQRKFGITKLEFDRFCDAVHNPAVSGDLARHANEYPSWTSNPMNLQEAKSFVEQLANRWLVAIREDLSGTK